MNATAYVPRRDTNGLESETLKLTTLLEMGQALTGTLQMTTAIDKALEILGRHLNVLGSAVTLLQGDPQSLAIVASAGYSANARGVKYRLGEGVTGRVVETGKPIVVPRISMEPMFLHRAAKRHKLQESDVSFICVPILVDQKPAGSLSVDLQFAPQRDYERSVKYYSVVASLFAQAVKIHRLVSAERQQLLDENQHLRGELQQRYDFSNIIGTSGPMRAVYEQVTQVARTNTTVMIRGESGTGKELIAHAIHYNSVRKQKPFIKVNCAALPETLIESELFGYEKGAFTGAQAQKKGRFELAEGGTLFLDEIGELNPSTAIKLLRVLQEREYERLGGISTLKADVRLIVATNKNLEKAIEDGSFRSDLYYRLNVFTLFMPPLRERRADILLLADYFLEKYSSKYARAVKRISTPAIDMLMCYHWPGNVRELENVMERAVVVCDDSVVHGHHLPPTLQTAEASGTVMSLSLKESVDAYEKDIIQDALKTTRGNRSRAALLLKTTERIVNYKVKQYGIDANRFRPQ
jgi:Nif-specific regulatory protein